MLRQRDEIARLASEAFETFRRETRLQRDRFLDAFGAGEAFHMRQQRIEILVPDFERFFRERIGVDEKSRRIAERLSRFFGFSFENRRRYDRRDDRLRLKGGDGSFLGGRRRDRLEMRRFDSSGFFHVAVILCHPVAPFVLIVFPTIRPLIRSCDQALPVVDFWKAELSSLVCS